MSWQRYMAAERMARYVARVKKPGTLRDLGGGRYQAVLYVGLDVLKKERRVTKVFRAPSDMAAGKKSTAIFKELEDRAKEAASTKGTVGQLADAWLKAKVVKGASPSTLDGVAPHIASIKKHLGRVKVADLAGEHVDAWLDALRSEKVARQRSEATVHHYFATLRTILRWARKKHLTMIVATEHTEAPTPKRFEARPPTSAAVSAALAAAGGDFLVALELLAATGMRRGELVGLRWVDLEGTRLRIERAIVEVDGGGVVVKAPKSGKSRTIGITVETAALLAAHRATLEGRSTGLCENAYMFPALRLAEDGSEPHRPTWVNLNWARVKRATGIRCRIHDLRHWHLSELLLRGVPMSVVSHRAGHTSEETTRRLYSHVLEDYEDAAAETVQLALGRG